MGGVAAVGLAGARRLAAAFAAGVLAWGVGVALLGATTSTAVALVLLAGVGIGNTVVDVAAVTLLQRSAADAVLGRVFGVLESVLLASIGIGSVLAPLAIHLLGVRPALVATGSGPSRRRGRVRPCARGPRRPRSRRGRPHAAHAATPDLRSARRGDAGTACAPSGVGRGWPGHGGDPSGRPWRIASTSSHRANWPWTWTAGPARTSARARSSARSRSCATCPGRRRPRRDGRRTPHARARRLPLGGHGPPDERRRGRPRRRDAARRAPSRRGQGVSEESTEQSMALLSAAS